MDPFIGEIRALAFTFAPMNWATCDGQLMPIQQAQALFSILGTIYGGNGTTNFGLPNLQGRAPMDFGAGPGLAPRFLGELEGAASVPLQANNIPSHTHSLNVVSNSNADQKPIAGHYLSKGGVPGSRGAFTPTPTYQLQASAGTHLAADAVQPAGTATGAIPHDNMQPYLPVLLCIALYGIYPTRS
ncbi:MAG TPA: tail fiber protein [Desulfuromonadaceae bacterium]